MPYLIMLITFAVIAGLLYVDRRAEHARRADRDRARIAPRPSIILPSMLAKHAPPLSPATADTLAPDANPL